MALQIIMDNDKVIVENKFYRVTLSKRHGGTIRKLEYNGKNVNVIREGCEYWEPNSPNHYEQEFSSIAEIEIIDRGANDDFLMLKVKSRLVSPQLKTDGGECQVQWLFRRNSPMIYSEYRITPTKPRLKSDRYLCFIPSAFNKYSIIKNDGSIFHDEIGAIKNGKWVHDYPDVKWGAVHDGDAGIALASAPKLNNMTFYKSPSMIEIKVGESNIKHDNNALYVTYLPMRKGEVFDEAAFQEMRLKFLLVRLCVEMKKEDSEADWFNRTLREHNRGLWFLKNGSSHLKNGMKVLDLAGGLGAWGAYLIYVDGLNLDYVNTDICSSRIEISKRLFDELGIKGRFIVCDWRKTYTEKQDVVLCFGALYHFDKYAFKVVNGLLRRGGLFIFEIVEKTADGPEGYSYALTIPEVRAELKNAGFEEIKIEYCAKYSKFNDIVVVSRKKWDCLHIKDQEERDALIKLAQKITDKNDSTLLKASKLSAYCKKRINFPLELPENRKWYGATGYESLTKWRMGNCLNYAKSLISLASSLDIEGRIIWISGKTKEYNNMQGHALCELAIDGKWILFDAMYGVPFLDKSGTETPSAYECWKNPMRYINAINPEYYGHTEEFWRGIWSDFHIHTGKSIKEMGEEAFIEQWYSSNPDIAELWWYTTFREKILVATDEELPCLYKKLYYEHLYERGHTPFDEFIPLTINDEVFVMAEIPNTYRFVRVLMKQFRENGEVLELGCGTSSFPFILATDGYTVTAIDLREEVIRHQRKFITLLPIETQKQLRFDCALAEALPYSSDSFDIIVGVDFLEHIRNIDRLLTECIRILKPNGKMFFATPIEGIGWSPEHLHNFTREGLEALFISRGLKPKFHLERYYWHNMTPNIFIVEVST